MTPSESNGLEPGHDQQEANGSSTNGAGTHRDHEQANGSANGTALVPVEVAYRRRPALINPPVLPPVLSAKPDSASLLRALKRRWLLAATLGLLAAAAAAALVWFLAPVTYTAQTFLVLSHKGSKIIGTDSDVDFSIFQRTQAALVKTRFVLNRALRQPQVAELKTIAEMRDNQVEWLENNLQVDFGSTPEFMRITLVGEKPQDLIVILRAVSEAYLDEAVNDELDARAKRLQRFKDVTARYDDSLRSKRRTYKDLAAEVGSSSSFVLAFKQQTQLDMLDSRRRMLLDVQNKLIQARTEAAVEQSRAKAMPAIEIPADVIERKLVADSAVAEMQKEMEKIETRAKRAAKGWADGADNPAVKAIESEKEGLRKALEELRARKRSTIAAQIRDDLQAREREALANGSKQILLLEGMEKRLDAEIQKLSQEQKSVAKTTVDLEGIKEELDSDDALAKTLHAMVKNEEINLNTPPRVTQRKGEEPEAKRTVKEDKQLMMAGATGAGAMVLVFLIVAYWEFLARRIVNPDDVVNKLGWPLVGSIPDIPNKHRRPRSVDSPTSKHWSSLLTESVDGARSMLLHTAAVEGIRTVMITSAVPGEGKTSLSCHLATSLARAGRKTLLIDGDLRRPSVHKMFDLPVDPTRRSPRTG